MSHSLNRNNIIESNNLIYLNGSFVIFVSSLIYSVQFLPEQQAVRRQCLRVSCCWAGRSLHGKKQYSSGYSIKGQTGVRISCLHSERIVSAYPRHQGRDGLHWFLFLCEKPDSRSQYKRLILHLCLQGKVLRDAKNTFSFQKNLGFWKQSDCFRQKGVLLIRRIETFGQ